MLERIDRNECIPLFARDAEEYACPVTARCMKGIGHLPMMEAPEQTARDYLAFHHQSVGDATPAGR
jgi:hypothetical protein